MSNRQAGRRAQRKPLHQLNGRLCHVSACFRRRDHSRMTHFPGLCGGWGCPCVITVFSGLPWPGMGPHGPFFAIESSPHSGVWGTAAALTSHCRVDESLPR